MTENDAIGFGYFAGGASMATFVWMSSLDLHGFERDDLGPIVLVSVMVWLIFTAWLAIKEHRS